MPIGSIAGLQLGGTIALVSVTEPVFPWPGTGWLFIHALQFAGIPAVAAYLWLIALISVATNPVVDLLDDEVKPRLRIENTASGH